MPSKPNSPPTSPTSPRPGGPSTLHRFYCPNLPHPRLPERHCVLDEAQARHARKVLRLQVGDALALFDGQGATVQAIIESFDSGLAVCRVEAFEEAQPLSPTLTVAAAIPKGPRADEMISLLSQFGADRLIPMITQRSEVKPRAAKLERFARAAAESAKQSRRPFMMRVDPQALTLSSVIEKEDAQVKLIATIGDFQLPDLEARLREARSVLVLIGPVGDWAPDEVEQARRAGYASWTLGPNVLRVEAAAGAAAAILRYLAMERG